MRPTNLVMNAFGPYKEKVELDFTKFGSSSIFLVSGPTGAGKTTIFDAITYALFNEASGSMRDVDTLKSQFASDEEECYVELTFDLGLDQYRIRRRPKQKGPGARKGSVQLQSAVELYKEDTPIATSITEANEAIESLLGLSYKQFCQIVMLPQGDFQELLQSNSDKKQDIFRSIFGTEPIQQFQNRLNEKRRELKKAYSKFEAQLEQSVRLVEETEHEALNIAIKEMDYEKTLEVLKELIAEGKESLLEARNSIRKLADEEKREHEFKQLLEELAKLEKQKQELEEKQPIIEKNKHSLDLHKKATEVKKENKAYEDLAETVQKTENELKKNKENVLKNAKEFEQLHEREKESTKELENLEAIRKLIQQLETTLELFDEIEKKTVELKEQEKQLKGLEKKLVTSEEQDVLLQDKIKKLTTNIEKMDDWKDELKKEEKNQLDLKDTVTDLKNEQKKLENIIEKQEKLAHLLEEEKEARAKQERSESTYQNARRNYFGNLAGVLASQLEEEKPCPVCGSYDHPNPAKPEADDVSDEELAQLENEQVTDKNNYTRVSLSVDQLAQTIQEQKVALKEPTDNYKEALEQTETQIKTVNSDLKACQETISQLEEQMSNEKIWRDQLEGLREQREANKVEQTTYLADAKNLRKAHEGLQTETDALFESLEYESKEIVQHEMDTHTEKIKQIEKEADEIRKELSDNQNQKASLESAIEVLSARQKTDRIEMEKQKERTEQLIEKHGFKEDFTLYLLPKEEEKEIEKTIQAYEKENLIHTNKWKNVKDRLEASDDKRSIQEVEEVLKQIEEKKDQLENRREKIVAQNRDYESSYQQIDENYQASKKIHKPLQVYADLAEVANGTTNRTSYVSFERYVLSIYLEEVLLAANERFEIMTNGRFEMVRREDRMSGRGAEGLEINVFDRHSGLTRSVRTLSGGETFKASLALALGLSDVIQNEQGGVQVETLFIDEGFGTLDADSLEMAIETLMDLQATGRLVGIISHVDELKDRIPARIVVENKKQGSHSRIEVD